jgi:hypothetical protein
VTRERAAASLIEMSYWRYLCRRQTRAFWFNFPVSVRPCLLTPLLCLPLTPACFRTPGHWAQRIDRRTLEFVLRRLNRPINGQRARLELFFTEYLKELPGLYEMFQLANKRHRALAMGAAGTVYAFGSNHRGQVRASTLLQWRRLLNRRCRRNAASHRVVRLLCVWVCVQAVGCR